MNMMNKTAGETADNQKNNVAVTAAGEEFLQMIANLLGGVGPGANSGSTVSTGYFEIPVGGAEAAEKKGCELKDPVDAVADAHDELLNLALDEAVDVLDGLYRRIGERMPEVPISVRFGAAQELARSVISGIMEGF